MSAVQVRDGLPIGQMPEWLGSALQKRPRRFNSGSGLHAPVARAERHRSSKSGHAGSNPVWSSTLLGANSARTIAQDIVVIVVLLLRWATGGCALEDQLLFHGRVAQRMSADFLHRRMHVRLVSRSPIGELTGRAFNAVPSPDSFLGELERPGRIGDGTSLSLWHFPDLVAGPGVAPGCRGV